MRHPIPLAIAALLTLSAGSAAAHPLDVAYLRMKVEGPTLSVQLDMDAQVASSLIGVGPLELQRLPARADALADATLRMAPIETDAGPCVWTGDAQVGLQNRTARVTQEAKCPAEATTIRWSFPFIAELPKTFQLLARADGFAEDKLTIVDHTSPSLALSSVDLNTGFGEFVWSGVTHIGASWSQWWDGNGFKLPDGIDHILFLLALLLGGGTLLELAGITTGFTLGHSVTLALAALNVMRPPEWLIEPVIALTIAAAAVEAFTGRLKRHRWKIATLFGLIHGFAFAEALTHLDLAGGRLVEALFGYNLGVEIGQLAFVLLFSLPVLYLHKKPVLGRMVVQCAAAGIFISGMYWFVERTFA